jgi:aminotransferase
MMESYNQRRKWFVAGLCQTGLPCHEPNGTFYAFYEQRIKPSPPGPNAEPGTVITPSSSNSRLANCSVLEEEGVITVPGSAFGPGGEGFIRCSYASSREQLGFTGVSGIR